MKNFKKLSREEQKSMVAGDIGPAYCFDGEVPGTGGCAAGYICSGGQCVPYINPGGGDGPGGGGGDIYTCICPWGTFTQSTPCPEFYCITG
ncbi:hypothetical protein H3Z85_06720 [Chryseobacterium indologenes]|uniref:bacteriocin-like protein n=2 Tax=Chryseobacterium indologenes TaxID=253 RepID=UPI0003E06367|nr:hypothetical protein [Chryseobacterium indologenes]QPQ53070.1 hypothetical protein H3Z85_06720 [Chryseobacterium indologenes]GAE66219.1 hypothetical protein CIN01S_14_00940 [Chryseobacterium indologenes NBRC 14944]SFK26979.1 hypothetical protein SAMN05421692_3925 [Chryseobacterium indologenes]SUX51856.1 Uncharacterised protein [Chryseobacterium indologenes]